MSLPENYLSPLHLPFNRTACLRQFDLLSPDGDPGGDGIWVPLQGERLLLPESGEVRLPKGARPPVFAGSNPLYFGRWGGIPCRLLNLAPEQVVPDGWVGRSLLAGEPELPIDLLTLGSIGRQVQHWEDNSRFCSACGEKLSRIPGEWGKHCKGCRVSHFPHVHPCVIVLIWRPGEVLLTRKAQWPAGRYSLVAGFLEPGECLEEAVVREVREEVGVEITDLRYLGSQNWPFPSQLMAGFTARFTGGDVRVQFDELEDARWFPVDDLPMLPPRRSIARFLLDHCLQG